MSLARYHRWVPLAAWNRMHFADNRQMVSNWDNERKMQLWLLTLGHVHLLSNGAKLSVYLIHGDLSSSGSWRHWSTSLFVMKYLHIIIICDHYTLFFFWLSPHNYSSTQLVFLQFYSKIVNQDFKVKSYVHDRSLQ